MPSGADEEAEGPPGGGSLDGLPQSVLRKSVAATEPDDQLVHFGISPTVDTTEENRSSFHLDVDTASYALTRETLGRGELPDPSAIRVEEFINTFEYRYDPPADGDFVLHVDMSAAPHRPGYHLMRLGLRSRDLITPERPPAHLAFVVDVSSSMDKSGRLGLVKRGLRLLVEHLAPDDRISIVTYGYRARIVLEPTPGRERGEILTAIDELRPEGATNLDAGLALAYEVLSRDFSDVSMRRLVLCSDGITNTGLTTVQTLVNRVEGAASQGLTLSAVGFGRGNYNDSLMEQLARRGRGSYAYVDRLEEARRVFAQSLTGELQVVATAAKLQVEFDPTAVSRFRLMGYELDRLGTESFDAQREGPGEIGAGHSITALYELELRQAEPESLGRVQLRYRTPAGQPRSFEHELSGDLLQARDPRIEPSAQLALVAAAFAEKLRSSVWLRDFSWAQIAALHRDLPPAWRQQPEVSELWTMIEKAADLSPPTKAEGAPPPAFERLSVLQ